MRIAAVILALCALLWMPIATFAARTPTRSERAAITAAIRRVYSDAPQVCFPLRVRISTRNSRYASADFRSSFKCGVVTGNGTYLLGRVSAKRWRVIARGSSFNCREPLPPAVMRDLLSYCRR